MYVAQQNCHCCAGAAGAWNGTEARQPYAYRAHQIPDQIVCY